MNRRIPVAFAVIAALAAGLTCAGAASAAPTPAPAWTVESLATPTNFTPGDATGSYSYEITIMNSGAEPTDGTPLKISDTLPEGLTVKGVRMMLPYVAGSNGRSDFGTAAGANSLCSVDESNESATVSCEVPARYPSPPFVETPEQPSLLGAGEALSIVIAVTPAGVTEGEVLTNLAAVEGGGAGRAWVAAHNEARSVPAGRGFSYFRATLTGPDGRTIDQAASHPFQYTTSFSVHTRPGPGGTRTSPFVPAGGDLKDISVALPPGLVGNPLAAPRCTAQQFLNGETKIFSNGRGLIAQGFVNECPDSSAVGFVLIQQVEGARSGAVPVYNLVPGPREPALLGFVVGSVPFYIDTELRTGGDYGITGVLHNNSEVKRVTAATVVLWGTPADPRHDPLRGSCLVPTEISGGWSLEECPAGIPPRPFFRVPSSCGNPLESVMGLSTWVSAREFIYQGSSQPGLTGCDHLRYEPSLTAQPTSDIADSPTGLRVDLHVPQKEHEKVHELAQADLRDVRVVLPPGLVINPSSANGLAACSEAQIALHSPGSPNCPAAAAIGTVSVNTPLLDHPLPGKVYVATPHANPFDSLLAIYVAVDDPLSGVVVKLAGKVEADPRTGQLTTTFSQNPQVPFEDFELEFYGGVGAALRTPQTCGAGSTQSTLTPWSAPGSGPPVTYADRLSTDRSPGGGACATSGGALPVGANFEAGTETPLAGAFSPMVIKLSRPDGSQEFGDLTLTPPPGLLARLAGIPYCPDSTLVAATGKSGREEEASPSCPAESRIGTVTIGAGAGPRPYYTVGVAYLAGPYKGAPVSLAIVTPATAGPYDLGTVVVRTALYVDPETAQITAKSDPIPHILQGIPLDVRSIAVKLDHSGWGLNPTNCEPSTFGGQLTGVPGGTAPLSTRFQVGECAVLPFHPKLSLRVLGKARRNAKPRLKAVLTTKPGEANITRAQVNLPHSEFLEQAHIRTICTRVQWAAGDGHGTACPKGSIYGRAKAWTPLLDKPLEGFVYLRSSRHKLPDLVAALNGQVDVELAGKVDSGPNEGIRNTFEVVPDAPVSRFMLEMKGGKKGLLVNSENLCSKKAKTRAIVRFVGHNGKVVHYKPKVRNSCKRRKAHRRHRLAVKGKQPGHHSTARQG